MTKRYFHILFMLAMAMALHAQTDAIDMEHYKWADEQQLWHSTQNAAGLAIDLHDSLPDRGVAYFNYNHSDGDFHRVQDGKMNNNLGFFTERYMHISRHLYGYGSFKFDMGRTKDRAWSDVIRSHESNPYFSGSSIPGKYDNQDFALNASLAYDKISSVILGANLQYHVGDLSRLRDPRSRINLAQYRITPSAIYTTGNHSVGTAFHYDRRKEKLPSLTTVQTDPTLKYYIFTGLENATGTIGGYQGYMREYVNHEFGGEISYQYQSRTIKSLTTATMAKGTEYIYGTNKYEPGRYFTYNYGISTSNRISAGKLLHSIDASISHEEAYADEYRQERLSTTDSVTGYNSVRWITNMTYKKRYQQKRLDAKAHYRLSFTKEKGILGYAGLKYQLHSTDIKRLLNTSTLKYSGSLIEVEGGCSLLKDKLWMEACAGYNFSTKADLDLNDSNTEYAQEVLIPDMDILSANYFKGQMKVTLQLPVTIAGHTNNCFACLKGDYLKADNHLYAYQIGCSIGLYY